MGTEEKKISYIAMAEDDPDADYYGAERAAIVDTDLNHLAHTLKKIYGDEEVVRLIEGGAIIIFKAERISVEPETNIAVELTGFKEI